MVINRGNVPHRRRSTCISFSWKRSCLCRCASVCHVGASLGPHVLGFRALPSSICACAIALWCVEVGVSLCRPQHGKGLGMVADGRRLGLWGVRERCVYVCVCALNALGGLFYFVCCLLLSVVCTCVCVAAAAGICNI
ncbi:unnamed protein product, partial [Discosporangium mesarthrocarpum]